MKRSMLASTIALLSGALISQAAAAANQEPIQPITPAKVTNPALVELGKKLYFDPRLSKSGFISCNSCHNLSMGGTDNIKTSIGHNWQEGPINAPTVLNSSLNLAQFWDGRAADLKAQAGGPIANPGEMAFSHTLAINVLQSIPAYVGEFKKAFGSETVDIEKVTKAIAAFEETLVTPNSRFDKWLKGDKKALSKNELEGYKLFKDSGCVACHNGPAVGGNSFQKMGRGRSLQGLEPGRRPLGSDRQGCRPLQLQGADPAQRRNDLSVLPRRRRQHAAGSGRHHGLASSSARSSAADENAKVVAFLKTLTGDQPNFKLPILPPSADATPRPTPFEKK